MNGDGTAWRGAGLKGAAPGGANRVGLCLMGLAILATAFLAYANLKAALPTAEWWAALVHPDLASMPQLIAHYAFLPRLTVGLLCGVGLGLAGVLFQQVLDNPLAEPGTLGVFAGAKLALALATLWAPALLALGYEPVAIAGGSACVGLVLLLARRTGFAPLAVILSGLVIALCFEAINKMLVIAYFEDLNDLFTWQAGWLNQNSWVTAMTLAPQVALAALAAAVLARPLALLDLDEAGARSVGLPIATIRFVTLVVGVLVSASVVGAVGVIGFIGLAGPALARASGARRLRDRLLWGSLASALLLTLADQAAQRLAGRSGIPVGAVTALLGAPLLIWLIVRLRAGGSEPRPSLPIPATRRVRPGAAFAWLLLLLVVAVAIALSLGRLPDGWHWSLSGADLGAVLPWRAPRVLAALGAGCMLGCAGALLQRLTGNPIASP